MRMTHNLPLGRGADGDLARRGTLGPVILQHQVISPVSTVGLGFDGFLPPQPEGFRRSRFLGFPASAVLAAVRKSLTRAMFYSAPKGPLPKSDLVEAIVARSEGDLTTADVNKATQLLYKAGLVEVPGKNDEGEVLWSVYDVLEADMFHAVDRAMVARLTGGLEELEASVRPNHVFPLLLGQYTDIEMDALIAEAAELASNSRTSE